MISFFTSLAANPVFAGLAGGAAVSAALYGLRRVPVVTWQWVQRQLSVTLVIDNDDGLFDRLCIYLSESPYVRRARWLRMVEMYDEEAQRWCWRASFGQGWHLVRDRGSWFLIHRHMQQESGALLPRRLESITLRTLGPDQEPLRGLMARAERVYESGSTVRVHVWQKGGWALADRKPARPLSTLFLPENQQARLVADLARFLGGRARYQLRGTPWRRGYLLEGPPGTGKTTIACVLAGIAGRPIYMINLNTAGGDAGLMAAFNSAEPGAIVVIEDIDSSRITHDRDASVAAAIEVKPEDAITLAGLLNVIDGLGSRENRILIVTSNHADKLDPALIRPGRIDVRERIGPLEDVDARRMSEAWLGDCGPWFDRHVMPLLPIAPATLQGLLLSEVEPPG